MESAIFIGNVGHRRLLPVLHQFRYRMFMMYLDLEELPGLFKNQWLWSSSKRNLAWFRRADYYGDPALPLKTAISRLVERETGQAPAGPVRLLTHMRYFGYCFNPVSIYYCYAADGMTLQAIVTDINNTPWGERHAYVLDCGKSNKNDDVQPRRFQFRKDFHVSPFMPMEIDYDWAFSIPSETLNVHMQNNVHPTTRLVTGETISENSLQTSTMTVKMFEATLHLERREISSSTLAWVLFAYPFMTLTVIAAIYWQALRLSIKRVPFITHPDKLHADKPHTG